jgi:outer membrane protein assembly factor BamB
VLTLRLGDRWRRGQAALKDGVSLEVEGVSLLPAVDEADLVAWLRGWLDALKALVVDRVATAQVSVDAPALELCLLRRPGLTLELSVVSLEPEPRRVSSPVTIDLVELRAAVETATRTFLRGAVEANVPVETAVALERKLREATGRAITPFAAQSPDPWRFSEAGEGVAFELDDRDGRTLLVTRGAGSLAALLTAGALRLGGTTSNQPPFLALMAAVRRRPSKATWELGLSVCAALHGRHPGWATNPWVDALFVRCTEGLASVRPPTPDVTPTPAPRPSSPRTEAPLSSVGTPRRVTLTPRWARPVALGEARGRLEVGRKLVVVHAGHSAQLFSMAGKELRRAYAPRGVAAAADGTVITATEERLTCFVAEEPSARWRRHDGGLRIGPELTTAETGLMLTRLGGRGVVALESMTGREAWRFDPPRAQRSMFVEHGARLVVGTDTGDLYGVDVSDGQVRFRIRGPVASPWPISALQRDAVAVLTQSSQTVVVRFAALAGGTSAQAGAVTWTRPLPLELASAPLVLRGRIFVAGRNDGRGAVACLSGKGEVLWLRSVPLDGATASIVAFERGVIASDARGAAVRLLPDGEPSWVLGGLDEAITPRLPPRLAKGVLLVPGTSVRLLDPTSGRVIAGTPPTPELADLAVGKGLTIFTYAEAGTLTCFEPGAVLSVVD